MNDRPACLTRGIQEREVSTPSVAVRRVDSQSAAEVLTGYLRWSIMPTSGAPLSPAAYLAYPVATGLACSRLFQASC